MSPHPRCRLQHDVLPFTPRNRILLEHLSTSDIGADALWDPFPRLPSLVLDNVILELRGRRFDAHPSLTVLAIVGPAVLLRQLIRKVPQHLEHLAYHPSNADSEHNLDMAKGRIFDLPPNLRSFTFVSEAPE